MLPLRKGRYLVRSADSAGDISRAQQLRFLSFGAAGRDADAHDRISTHILVEEQESGALVCCFRILLLPDAAEVGHSYAAQFYDLAALSRYPGALLEIGRFCLHPDWHDPDILRLAWGALTGIVDAAGVAMLFGCASFHGTDPACHAPGFALLNACHLAPARWRPGTKAGQIIDFAKTFSTPPADNAAAFQSIPPLLRSYLSMGGRVSDHAVIDQSLNTMHVFTGVEVATIPAARARLLRAIIAK